MEPRGGGEDFDIHDEEEQSAFDHRPGYDRTRGGEYPNGQENVGKRGLADEPSVVAPPLRSTIQSREIRA